MPSRISTARCAGWVRPMFQQLRSTTIWKPISCSTPRRLRRRSTTWRPTENCKLYIVNWALQFTIYNLQLQEMGRAPSGAGVAPARVECGDVSELLARALDLALRDHQFAQAHP